MKNLENNSITITSSIWNSEHKYMQLLLDTKNGIDFVILLTECKIRFIHTTFLFSSQLYCMRKCTFHILHNFFIFENCCVSTVDE